MSTPQRTETESSTSKISLTRHKKSPSSSTALNNAPPTTDSAEPLASDPKGPLGLNLLHTPAEPLLDFIFVHGLGGGSRKTWSKTSFVRDYWPQEWLPKDPAFSNVRIHSFGYNSDWVKGKKNCLNIHHFGKSLLSALTTKPCLRDGGTPIVLIGHSMGGLVIKKAYNLARQDANFETIARRFHTIYFLATPHNGSDSAKLLSDVLQVAGLSYDFVGELKRNSGTIQSISDDFQNYSTDLDLWSFYETVELSLGNLGKFLSRMIVTPDSAVLGFRDEKQTPMNADHRSICKFDSILDPNYQTVRDSLETTVVNIEKTVRKIQHQVKRSQIQDLENYLGIPERMESDLATVEDARLPRTCEWFSAKSAYQHWANFEQHAPAVLWVAAKPAAGKSIIAGYTVGILRKEKADCSYFFFKYADEAKSRLSTCLRHLAFQMACRNLSIREKLLEMQREGIKFDKDNERTVWRKLFLSGIFQTQFSPHYWIIDALDECVNSGALFNLVLKSLGANIPLRILVTSRMTGDLENSFRSLGYHQYQLEQISISDTLPDIKLLIKSKAKTFNVKAGNDSSTLVEKILQKSNGSFLWTVLVLELLSNSHSEEQISQVLDDVPRGMKSLYQRTLDIMSQNTRRHGLTSAILVWATCAMRPLSIMELDAALNLDMNETSLDLEKTISTLCGQLVTVDKFCRVQMVHETAREFLQSAELRSEFAIKTRQAHTRIAKSCLLYLTSDEMKPPRSGRRPLATTVKRSDFSSYACTTFSYHLAKSDPCADDVLNLVDKFLKCNVLSWIEFIARSQDLLPLIRVAMNLRKYLSTCSAERSPLSREMSLIRGWTTDLIRITAKFADALILSPSAIYSLLLPFCPTSSSVYNTANNGRRPTIMGLSISQWDDRMSCIDFHQGQTSAICAGDEFLAVGLMKGMIYLYHAASYQEYRLLDHGEAVLFLQFKPKSDLMLSCGIKAIRIWDVRRGETIHNFQAPQRPICLAFDQNLLIAASHQNSLATWDLENDGARMPDKLWNDSLDQTVAQLRRPPCAIAISVSHQILAVAYSGKPILLWDLAGDVFYGNCGRKLANGETSTHVVSALVFNPNINIALLAASYLDGQLALLDPFDDQELVSFRADCHTLVASHDGRLLAGGTGSGIIQVYEFDTLRLLYRVKSSNFYIEQLSFSPDGLHFADIRGSQCNVWEPAALLRDMVGDNSSIDSSSSVVETISSDSKIRISALTLHPNAEVSFCGKENGSVSSYNLKNGAQMGTLYDHKSLVRILNWCPLMDVIVSVDTSNCIIAWKLNPDLQYGWTLDKQIFQSRLDCGSSITQVLAGEATRKLILSTRDSDHFWSMEGRQEEVHEHFSNPGIRLWFQHPQSPVHMICINSECARVYTWSDWSEVARVSLNLDLERSQLKRILPFTMDRKQRILIEISELNGSPRTHKIHIANMDSFNISRASTTDLCGNTADVGDTTHEAQFLQESHVPTQFIASSRSQIDNIAGYVSHIIGISDSGKLVFLDIHLWVCSTDLQSVPANYFSYSRHFFVPYDWFSGTRDIICALKRRDVIFTRNNDLAVIKGGLEYIEKVDVQFQTTRSKG